MRATDILKPYFSSLGLRRMLTRKFYMLGANDQKKLTLKAFDEWLQENSWITRDESNRKPMEELRNIIQAI